MQNEGFMFHQSRPEDDQNLSEQEQEQAAKEIDSLVEKAKSLDKSLQWGDIIAINSEWASSAKRITSKKQLETALAAFRKTLDLTKQCLELNSMILKLDGNDNIDGIKAASKHGRKLNFGTAMLEARLKTLTRQLAELELQKGKANPDAEEKVVVTAKPKEKATAGIAVPQQLPYSPEEHATPIDPILRDFQNGQQLNKLIDLLEPATSQKRSSHLKFLHEQAMDAYRLAFSPNDDRQAQAASEAVFEKRKNELNSYVESLERMHKQLKFAIQMQNPDFRDKFEKEVKEKDAPWAVLEEKFKRAMEISNEIKDLDKVTKSAQEIEEREKERADIIMEFITNNDPEGFEQYIKLLDEQCTTYKGEIEESIKARLELVTQQGEAHARQEAKEDSIDVQNKSQQEISRRIDAMRTKLGKETFQETEEIINTLASKEKSEELKAETRKALWSAFAASVTDIETLIAFNISLTPAPKTAPPPQPPKASGWFSWLSSSKKEEKEKAPAMRIHTHDKPPTTTKKTNPRSGPTGST